MTQTNGPKLRDDFKSKKIKRTFTQKINSTPDKIFPLLCPEREKDWLDGWSYDMIYSESGFAENGAIFKTRYGETVDTIWIVTKYDKELGIIEFVRMTWDVVVVNISFRLEAVNDTVTDIHVEYIFTSITEKGNEFIEGSSSRQFLEMMKWWEKSLNYFIMTGNKLLAIKL
ncbi:MAG: hypothetical protein WCJ01_00040 [Ignavibacteria bacterium]